MEKNGEQAMEITEVKVYPKKIVNDKKLKAFVTITFDNSFVVRDIKIIESKKGLFVAMPSAKITASCPECSRKNPVRNVYCGFCGVKLEEFISNNHEEEHRDVAHPINAETRKYIHDMIMKQYDKVLQEEKII
ncbi:septation protein SpoVG family protein [bacterium]|nr:septation protein SpoVG family protein [bacterium]